jgi:hypothetical protein
MTRERTYLVHPFDDVYEDFLRGPWNLQLQTRIATYLPGPHAVSTEQLRELSSAPVILKILLNDELVSSFSESTEIDLSQMRLSIRSYSRFLNLSQVAFSKQLSEIDDLSEELEVQLNMDQSDRSNPVMACHTGFDVQAVITLDKNRQVAADQLVPKRRFTILASDLFKLRPASGSGLGIQFLKLSPEIRRIENVPGQSYLYVKSIEKSWTVQKITDCVLVFVDALLLEKSNLLRGKKRGQRQFLEIYVQIIDVVLQDFSRHLASLRINDVSLPSYDSINKTVAGKVMNILHLKGNGMAGKLDHDQLIAELADYPNRSRSRAQAALGYLDSLLDAFDEEERP